MPSSRRPTLAPEARDDLIAILQHSLETWGERQADRDAEQIRRALANVVRFPGIGQTRDEVSPGLLSPPIGQHVAYSRVSDDEVSIRRLFHRRQSIGPDTIP